MLENRLLKCQRKNLDKDEDGYEVQPGPFRLSQKFVIITDKHVR